MTTALTTTLSSIARAAGGIALEARRGELRRWTKQGNELVTSAELAIHDHVIRELSRTLPGVSLLTEESKEHAIPPGPFVVVDEIDGTAPYVAGADTWGVMIALVEERPTCGVVHLPDKNVTITAQSGQGCWIDDRRIRTHFTGPLREATAGADLSAGLDDAGWRQIRGIARTARTLRCLGSAAASACEFLQGITQLYANPVGGKIWDFAPIAIAVTEAGGVTSTAEGGALQWNRVEMSFLACATAELATEVLALR
jgi:fructose-1,6-bisphosphatase/inositol monophosphatase family enzyme